MLRHFEKDLALPQKNWKNISLALNKSTWTKNNSFTWQQENQSDTTADTAASFNQVRNRCVALRVHFVCACVCRQITQQ